MTKPPQRAALSKLSKLHRRSRGHRCTHSHRRRTFLNGETDVERKGCEQYVQKMVGHVHHHPEYAAARDESEHSDERIKSAEHLEVKASIRARPHCGRNSHNTRQDVYDIVHRVNLKDAKEHPALRRDTRYKPQNTDRKSHNTEDPSQLLNHTNCCLNDW